jgi:hypothetical protein
MSWGDKRIGPLQDMLDRILKTTVSIGPHTYPRSIKILSWEEARPLQDGINKSLESIHTSPALPTDLRLPGSRKLQVGAWYAYPTSITPEDTTNNLD